MAQGSADRLSGTGPFSLRFRFPAHPVDEAIGSGAARIVRGGRMMEDFSGKVVIVTGGGRGVGRGIARAFAAAGAVVMRRSDERRVGKEGVSPCSSRWSQYRKKKKKKK